MDGIVMVEFPIISLYLLSEGLLQPYFCLYGSVMEAIPYQQPWIYEWLEPNVTLGKSVIRVNNWQPFDMVKIGELN